MKDNAIGCFLWMLMIVIIMTVMGLLGLEGCTTDYINGVCQ